MMPAWATVTALQARASSLPRINANTSQVNCYLFACFFLFRCIISMAPLSMLSSCCLFFRWCRHTSQSTPNHHMW